MTETVFALGMGAALVGRTSFCDYPPEAASVAVIGGFADPSIEKILSLSPTLVCGERGPAGPELPAALERQGVQTFFPVLDEITDIETMIEDLAVLLGAADQGRAVARSVRERVAAVGLEAGGAPRPRVVFLFDWKPLFAAGKGSFPDEVLRAAGGDNAVTTGGKYPELGPEGLLALDPDVVIDGSAGAYQESPEELARSIPGLGSLRALEHGRLYRLTSTAALRPGPRIGEGVAEVARWLKLGRLGAP